MTTQTAPEPNPTESAGRFQAAPTHEFVEYERYIDQCVRRTQGTVKMVDLFAAIMTLVVSLLSVLLVAALCDHWILPGGLGAVGRWFFLLVCLGVCVGFVWRRLWPIVFQRVNPEYAADAIERHTPSLKNSLLNFLFFRRSRRPVPAAVFEVIEQQAAVGLSDVSVETAVDRSHLVRLGYALVVLLVCGVAYTLFSPKNPLQTVARVATPWADIAVPSRVEILDIRPDSRDLELPRGSRLSVSAKVKGVDDGDPVTVYYSTADRRIVDQPIAMHVPTNDFRYACQVPDDEQGIQQDVTFRIEAGDARTATYRVRMTPAPTIDIDSVHYEYPAYTGYVSREVDREGDLRAIEGTRVTIHARANQRIESAHVDFDCDGKPDQAMRVDQDAPSDENGAAGTWATVSFPLGLNEDRTAPRHTSYQLRFTNQAGHRNLEPIRYAIDVTPDLAPEIEIRQPREREIELPENATLDVETAAVDPDFSLRRVRVTGRKIGPGQTDDKPGAAPLFTVNLLDQERSGQFLGRYQLAPRRLALKAGDLVEFWAVATDNKAPEANRTETERFRVRILPSEGDQGEPAPDSQRPDGGQKPDADQTQQPQDGGKADSRKEQDPSQQPGKSRPGAEGQQEQPAEDQGQPDRDQTDENKGDKENEQPGEPGAQDQKEQRPQDRPRDQQNKENGKDQASKDEASGEQDDSKSNQQGVKKPGEQDPSATRDDQPGAGSQESQPSSEGSEPDAAAGKGASPSDRTGDKQSGQPGEGASQSGASAGKENSDQQTGSQEPGEQQPGEQPEDAQAIEDSEPVPSDGTDDGKAFERMQEHFQEKAEDDTASGSQRQSGAQDDQTPASDAKEETPADQRPKAQPADATDSATGATQDAESEDARNKETSDQAPDDPQTPQGGQPKPDTGDAQGQPGSTAPRPPKPGADSSLPKTSKDQRRPDDNTPSPEAKDSRKSDSQGADSGDRSGGGKKGQGQQADREGTGAAGNNQPAEDGGATSSETGGDRQSEKAGADALSDNKTGASSGDQKGAGSESRPGESGDSPQGDSASGDSPKGDSPRGDSPSLSGQREPTSPDDSTTPPETPEGRSKSDAPSSEPVGGGSTGPGEATPRPVEQEPGADKANLDYARKSTDLVLERLEDQIGRQNVDQDLLDKLGWTEEDMRRFVERWRQLKDAARGPNADNVEAKRELDQRLRSLGFREKQRIELRGGQRQDTMRGMSETRRRPPPASIQELLKAYQRGTSRAATKD